MNEFTNKKTAVALGTFDGLHKGHLSVINPCIEKAKYGLTPVVLLFSCHPSTIIFGRTPSKLLTETDRNNLIKSLGAEYEIVDFATIQNMDGEEFFTEILLKKLNAGYISCGFNFRFAKNGSCNTDTLKNLCEKYNIELNISQSVLFHNEPISSSRIRNAITEGKIEYANEMFGRPFSFDFEVIHGDEIGRTIGFPTANQHFPPEFTIPEFGVYVSETEYNGKKYPSVSNIGCRPTVNGKDIRCETHIIGFNENLYDKHIKIELLSFIREEKKFNSLNELKKQINTDTQKAISLFSERK